MRVRVQEAHEAWMNAELPHVVCRQAELMESIQLAHGHPIVGNETMKLRFEGLRVQIDGMRARLSEMRGKAEADNLLRHTMLVRRVQRLRTNLAQTERHYILMCSAWPADCMQDEFAEYEHTIAVLKRALRARGIDAEAALQEDLKRGRDGERPRTRPKPLHRVDDGRDVSASIMDLIMESDHAPRQSQDAMPVWHKAPLDERQRRFADSFLRVDDDAEDEEER